MGALVSVVLFLGRAPTFPLRYIDTTHSLRKCILRDLYFDEIARHN